MDIQKERELFLAHMRSIGSAGFMFELDEDGNFDDMSMAYAWSAWQAAKANAVPEGFVLAEKAKIESWYLDENEGMYTDEPDNFLHELEIGEVQAVERKEYLIVSNKTLYAARPWDKDSQEVDCWQFYNTKEEADQVAADCEKQWSAEEAQESSHD